MKPEHFKGEGLHTVKASDWMAKMDLKDAFFMVPKAPQFCHLLFKFWEKTFRLPFGLCTAPKVFAKILKLLVEMLRSLGIQLVIYILLQLDNTTAAAYINGRMGGGGQHHQSCLS